MEDEEDDSGMGVVKRRRSRRLLEARRTAETPSQERVTTSSAAAAWGDMLQGGPEAEPAEDRSRPSAVRVSRPPSEALRTSAPPVEPSPRAADAPRAPLRGMPLSSRPPMAAPPVDEPAPERRPRPEGEVRTREALRSGERQAFVTQPPGLVREPDTGPPARQPPPGFEAAAAVARSTLPPAEEAFSMPEETTIEVVAPSEPAPRARRSLLGPLVVAALLVVASIWTAAVIFDEMGRTERLERVGRALSTAGQRILRDQPTLAKWPGPNPDPIAVNALKEKEISRLVEAVAAAGYAPGVYAVDLTEDGPNRRLVVEARLPNAVVAWGVDGQWVHPPPPTGVGPAIRANLASILGSFALPLAAWIGFVWGRRRRA